MIKGTNRRVVEINGTGSEVFERILIVLKPEYGDMSKDAVARETDKVVRRIVPPPAPRGRRRKKIKSFFFDLS